MPKKKVQLEPEEIIEGDEEEEIIEGDEEEELPLEKMKYDEYGRPAYDNRYILSVEKKDKTDVYSHVQEGNVLKELKLEAKKLLKKEKRKIVIWDRENWSNIDIFRIYPEEKQED